jgi:hypothetical protein
MAIAGVIGHAPRRWVYGWALPCALVPIAVAVVGGALSNRAMLALFLVCIIWMSAYGHLGRPSRSDAEEPVP